MNGNQYLDFSAKVAKAQKLFFFLEKFVKNCLHSSSSSILTIFLTKIIILQIQNLLGWNEWIHFLKTFT